LARCTASSLSVFGRPGAFFTSRALTSPSVQASRLHQGEERPPPGAGRLQHHLLDPLASQVSSQLDDLVRGRPDRPHRGYEPARPALARHPGAHPVGALATPARSDPGHRLLILAILDLLRLEHLVTSATRRHQ
jgi:hypothetical protein